MTTAMTNGEREDLQRLIRQREKVLKSAAKQRSAELLADFCWGLQIDLTANEYTVSEP